MKILELGDILKRDTALAAQPAKSVVGVPVDEMGQAMTRTDRPLFGPMFFGPRVFDRRSQVFGSWSADQIINALAARENGDMGPLGDLAEWMADRDAAYFGFRQTRILTPAKLRWSVEPGDDSPLAKEIAEFATAEIKAIPNFQHAYRDAFDAIGVGVSALWIDWQEGGRKFKGGKPKSKYRIDGIHHINPKRYRFHWLEEKFLILPDWAFARAQDLGLMNPSYGPTQFSHIAAAGLGIEPPPWKCVIHRTRTKSGHPAKAGIVPVCAPHVYFRLKATIDLSTYTEIFGMPGRVAKYPPGMSEPEKLILQAAMDRIGTDMSAIIANDVEIQWLESKSRTGGGLPYIDLLKESERQMQLAWLGQDQTNTHNDAGGRTQVAEGGAPIRQDLVEADCIDAQATWTMQLVKPIIGFSDYGWDAAETLCPKFKIHYEQEEDYVSMAEVDAILVGKVGLKQTQGQIATRYRRDLPDGVSADEIVVPPAPASPFGTAQDAPPSTPDVPTKKPATKPPMRIVASANFAAETDTEHSYASTQINIAGSVRTSVLDLAAMIPDDALAGDGRESNPHVTVLYGIDPSVTIDELRAVIGPRATGSLTLGATAFFAGPDADVVFVTVDSPDLVALNGAIRDAVKTTDTQPNYVPHLTLAYVESGRGHEFAGNGALNGVKFDYSAVHYYGADGNATKIQAIRGHVRVRPVKAAMSFYEPKFWNGEDVPDGWPDDFAAAGALATYQSLELFKNREPNQEKRAAIEYDQEMIRRDTWAMIAEEKQQMAATNTKPTSAQAAIDDFTAKTMKRAEAAFASLAKDVRDVIEQAEREGKSIKDIPDLLRAAFPKMDARRLARLSARTVFVAGLHGRATAKRTPTS